MRHRRPAAWHGVKAGPRHREQLDGAGHLVVLGGLVVAPHEVKRHTVQAVHVHHLPDEELPQEAHHRERPPAVRGGSLLGALLFPRGVLRRLGLPQGAPLPGQGSKELSLERLWGSCALRLVALLALLALLDLFGRQLRPSRVQRHDDVGALLELPGLLQRPGGDDVDGVLQLPRPPDFHGPQTLVRERGVRLGAGRAELVEQHAHGPSGYRLVRRADDDLQHLLLAEARELGPAGDGGPAGQEADALGPDAELLGQAGAVVSGQLALPGLRRGRLPVQLRHARHRRARGFTAGHECERAMAPEGAPRG
mmetsp:Transcript_107356/g.334625  ORF Transcript_107356/g.334625 Transcript_107356/m.334625 type:complete len:309 (+) Transcript_107356:151-1077(+)